jgi:hypothetical protein
MELKENVGRLAESCLVKIKSNLTLSFIVTFGSALRGPQW